MGAALLLSGADIERLLGPEACIAAVEDAFRRLAEGRVPAPAVLAMHAASGSFHVKAGLLEVDGLQYFAAKLNANFPGNRSEGLPTIQGAVLLSDAIQGRPLAIMDSIAITALRTAAASAVAARHLAREECDTMLICGCGGQARSHVEALLQVRKPRRILAYDPAAGRAEDFAQAFDGKVTPATALADAARMSDIIVTCTTSTRAFLTRDMVRPGAFVAAVGADSESKQEIDPWLMSAARVVTDITAQARSIGDLHHAIAAGTMSEGDVHAQIGEVVAGMARGRTRAEEIFIFDSTGTGLQDVAAAIAVYRRAVLEQGGAAFDFSGGMAG